MNPYIIFAAIGWLVVMSVIGYNVVKITGLFVNPGITVNEIPSNISTETQEALKCPSSCDDGNPCTTDYCDETTDYKCVNAQLNGTSTEGCFGLPSACRVNTCIQGKCVEVIEANCCGNAKCELAEGCLKCPEDCGACPLPSEETIQPIQTATTQPTETSTAAQPSLNHITINEFTTNGPNGSYDEFAELYNPTNNDINITGWKLQYKSATGDTWQSKVGAGLTGVIKAKSFFLLASKSYSLTTTPDYKHGANWGLADAGGHLRLIDSNANVIDKVGWGNADEPEGSPAPALEANKSLERKSLTTDTDNNSNDFILINPSPKNSTNQ